ncbi:phosphomannomutase/phosphoglucomutase [Caldisericum sp.]|uniref:phosphomannomutase/phosphoglucomutase n=1 Tax=Caldisericum sp. TaxID=2499687 RepID=UPI003D143DCE
MNIDSTIFRMYDIRGEVDKNLTEEVVNAIGRSYAIYLKDKFKDIPLTVSVGRDIRLHSEKLKDALISGILSEGVQVIDIGVSPTPVLYFSLFNLPVDGGIMITGSHNPPEYNGMKICVGKETIYGEEIQKLYKIVKSLPPKIENKNGQLSHFDILSKYKKFLLSEFKVIDNIASSISIAVDSGNGCAGMFVPQLLKELGIKVIDLYSEPDGNFPNHHPDPTLVETLSTLQDTVKNNNLDFGIAYDGDVDRLGVVDEKGNVVYGDKLTYIFAKDILKTHPKGKIIGEVKCSKTLFDGVRELDGIPILSPVGHSLIKKKMKEENALLAGEMSGHIFFNDRYFGYDDAIYATLRLIEIFAKEKSKNNNFKFSDLLKDLPETYVSPEIRVDCKEEEKFALVEQFLAKYKEKFPKLADKIKNVITIDGIRIEFSDGWGLIRASNTQPVLVMRFEAETLEALEEYEQSFKITLGGDK